MTKRVFNLPLGTRFKYTDCQDKVFVLLSYEGTGICCDLCEVTESRVLQGVYSVAETRHDFEHLMVEPQV